MSNETITITTTFTGAGAEVREAAEKLSNYLAVYEVPFCKTELSGTATVGHVDASTGQQIAA